jgi:hypothetical protein
MASETNSRFFIGTCGYSYPGEPPNGRSKFGRNVNPSTMLRIDSANMNSVCDNKVKPNRHARPRSVSRAPAGIKVTDSVRHTVGKRYPGDDRAGIRKGQSAIGFKPRSFESLGLEPRVVLIGLQKILLLAFACGFVLIIGGFIAKISW